MENVMALEGRRPIVHALEIITKITTAASKLTLKIIYQMRMQDFNIVLPQ
jgi:hypothetical protein